MKLGPWRPGILGTSLALSPHTYPFRHVDGRNLPIACMQPNIAGSWATISDTDIETIQGYATEFERLNLCRSTCRVTGTDSKVQLQGRWSLHFLDKLIALGIIKASQVSISSLNICQSRIFAWLLIGKSSAYLCRPTGDTVAALRRYIPHWCSDIDEVSSARLTSLKMKSDDVANDATELVIRNDGSLQYQGRPEYVTKLHEAVAISIRGCMKSVFMRRFVETMQYTSVEMNRL
jgi:hypothetical protein